MITRRYLFVLVLFALVPVVQAQTSDPSQENLSAVAFFHRCYAQLTGMRAPKNHVLLQQVRSGRLNPLDACMQVLSKANMVPLEQSNLSTEQKVALTPSDVSATFVPHVVKDREDPEALAVLNTFHNFHRMLFEAKDFDGIPADGRLLSRFNDPTEPALFLTRLLFEPNAKYRESVTGQYAVRGIRSLGAWVRNFRTGGSSIVNLPIPGTGLDRGVLWGLGTYSNGNKTWLTDNGALINALNVTNSGRLPILYTISSPRSFGGGIMGLQSYVVMNSGFPVIGGTDSISNDPTEIRSGRSNASKRMHRRWSQNVLNDLLCRPLPSLRASDVTTLVTNYVATHPDANTQLPFRVSGQCMACHASIDPMAATIRALYFQTTTYTDWLRSSDLIAGSDMVVNPPVTFVTAAHLRSNATSLQPAESPPGNEYTMMNRDSLFSNRPGSGDLRYRSYDGTLVWQHFTATGAIDGLSQMGEAMAIGDDLYVCAAARYLNYFTGIEINLDDIGDPINPPLSEDDLYYRNVAIELGKKLKVHQSLTQLIRDILSLRLYQKIGMKDVAP